jgi:2-hydroxychromene-2-carboxylate isomerase
MDQAIDFYFDFTSPYAYLAAANIDRVAAEHGRTVRWHPVLLAAMSEATGIKLAPMVPIKWTYVQMDLERSARRHGLPYKLPPAFPQLWLSPGRAMLWVEREHGEEKAREFARACFYRAFGMGVDINAPEVLADIGAGLGIDGASLAAGIGAPETKAAFKTSIAQALERGVFGVPFVIADGQAFWGNDRLDELAAHLRAAALALT